MDGAAQPTPPAAVITFPDEEGLESSTELLEFSNFAGNLVKHFLSCRQSHIEKMSPLAQAVTVSLEDLKKGTLTPHQPYFYTGTGPMRGATQRWRNTADAYTDSRNRVSRSTQRGIWSGLARYPHCQRRVSRVREPETPSVVVLVLLGKPPKVHAWYELPSTWTRPCSTYTHQMNSRMKRPNTSPAGPAARRPSRMARSTR